MKTPLLRWLFSIVVCSFILVLQASSWSGLGFFLLVIDILAGIVFFIQFIITVEKRLNHRFGKVFGPLLAVASFFLSLVAGIALIFGMFAFNANVLKLEPIPTPTPIPAPTIQPIIISPTPTIVVAKVVKQVTQQNSGSFELVANPDKKGEYSMNAPDEKMATVAEVNLAMNVYRRAHGLNELSADQRICDVANRRANEIVADFSHNGMDRFMEAGGGWESTGFKTFGENIFYGSFSGVHMVEYAWDKSPGHRANMLREWSAGCAGIYGVNVSFVFAK